MTTLDLEAEYNNRARVPDSAAIIAGWARDAAAYRARHAPALVRYGAGERHVIDVFGEGDGALVLFIHGGYWQALDKNSSSHMAAGLNARGVRVAVMSYDLCPQVRIGAIVEQARAACVALHRAYAAPIVASGHSAGGHLAACLLAREDCVPAAYAISGVFDLAPLIATSLNGALQLDAAEAHAQSPIHWPPPRGKTLDLVVGASESGAFLRQSQAMAEAWAAGGVRTAYAEEAGANHFTIIAPLADANSAMCARLKAIADVAR